LDLLAPHYDVNLAYPFHSSHGLLVPSPLTLLFSIFSPLSMGALEKEGDDDDDDDDDDEVDDDDDDVEYDDDDDDDDVDDNEDDDDDEDDDFLLFDV
jgi:hypothetical protein